MRTKICIGVITVLAAWDCQAQRPPAVSMDPRYFRVDFIIPGARPSGLAGAFIAAAQDEISRVRGAQRLGGEPGNHDAIPNDQI
jgi:hypothetical protein